MTWAAYSCRVPLVEAIDTSREDRQSRVASDYIEKNRKTDVSIKIVDSSGKSVPNAKVTYRQVSHDFILSSLPPSYRKALSKTITTLWNDLGLDYIDLYVHWPDIEPEKGKFDFTVLDNEISLYESLYPNARMLAWIKSVINPHTNDYWTPAQNPPYWSKYPQITRNSTAFEEYKAEVYDYVFNVVSHYKSKIKIWETQELVNLLWLYQYYKNQIIPGAGYGTIDQAIGLTKIMAKAIRDADPSATIMVQTGAPSGIGYIGKDKWDSYDFAKKCVSDGVDFDAIGIDVQPNLGWGPADFYDYANRLLELGKKVSFGRARYPSSKPTSPWYWASSVSWDTFNQEFQAEWLRYCYLLAYGTKNVIRIGFLIFKDNPSTFYGTGAPVAYEGWGLLDGDGNPKKAYAAVKKLIDGFTTTGSVTTPANMTTNFRGFAGNYSLIVEAEGYRTLKSVLHVVEGADNVFTLTLEKTGLAIQLPESGQWTNPVSVTVVIVGVCAALVVYALSRRRESGNK